MDLPIPTSSVHSAINSFTEARITPLLGDRSPTALLTSHEALSILDLAHQQLPQGSPKEEELRQSIVGHFKMLCSNFLNI